MVHFLLHQNTATMGQQEIFTSSKDSEKAGFSNDSTQLTSYAEGDTTLIHEGDGMKRAIKSRHAQVSISCYQSIHADLSR